MITSQAAEMSQLLVVALVVQVAVEAIKRLAPEKTGKYTGYLAIGAGILISYLAHTGLLAAFGLAVSYQPLDWILGGLAAAGGAGLINEAKDLLIQYGPPTAGNQALVRTLQTLLAQAQNMRNQNTASPTPVAPTQAPAASAPTVPPPPQSPQSPI